MEVLARLLSDRRLVAFGIALAAAATVGTALVFQHGFGYQPCKLCLIQRWPYYVGAPLALATALAEPRSVNGARAGLGLLAIVFLISAGLGIYHSGVEWGLFLGPSDCGGGGGASAGNMGDFMRQLQTTRVVSCTEAAWRFLGLSMAGWNALISLGLAAVAAISAWNPGRILGRAAG